MFKIVVQPIAFKEEHLPAVSFLLIPSPSPPAYFLSSPLSVYLVILRDTTELASKLVEKIGGPIDESDCNGDQGRIRSPPLFSSLSLFLSRARNERSLPGNSARPFSLFGKKGTLSRDNRSLSLSVKRSMNKRFSFFFFLFVHNWEEREKEREKGARFFL